MLEAGSDFADAAIAYEGNWLGSDAFVAFDKAAIRLLARQGYSARFLA
jgi:transposase